MGGGRLTPLQERILGVLVPLSPPWTLTGGAALAAVDAQHREGVCIVDLVAEPGPALEAPRSVPIAGVAIRVDSLHEILVNKLTALLEQTEPRDL